MQEQYGIDLSSGILKRRTWRWLRLRAYGLLSTESRLQRVLRPAKAPDAGRLDS